MRLLTIFTVAASAYGQSPEFADLGSSSSSSWKKPTNLDTATPYYPNSPGGTPETESGNPLDFNAPPVGTDDTALERATGLITSEARFPLATSGRYIVDRLGGRVKWACVNWHGAHQQSYVMGGLNKQPLKRLAERIASLGFNCVRLTYSTEAVVKNPIVPWDRVTANPELYNKTFLECFDAVVDALTQAKVMMIINNHMNRAGWCCNIDQDEGLWYNEDYNASTWLWSVVTLAKRYSKNKWVVAHDLRNEPHTVDGVQIAWGNGDPATDYLMAMTKAGNAVLQADPGALIVIEGLCFGMELRFLQQQPVKLDIENKVVYEVHNYQEFQFTTLFTSHFFAWSFVRRITGLVVCVLTGLMMLTIYSCHRLRWPWAPRGVFLVTFGSWTTIFSLGLFMGAVLTYHYYSKYCNFIANLDVLPWIYRTGFFTCFGVVLLLIGFVRFGVFGQHYSRMCSPGGRNIRMSDEDYSDDGTFDTDEEGAEVLSTGSSISEGSEPDFACFRAFVRAKVKHEGGPCCFKGTRSLRLVKERVFGRHWRSQRLPRPEWDCGICLIWQLFCGLPAFLILLGVLWYYALNAPLYKALEDELDSKWGFVLHDGNDYTAPVWMGEFGAGQKGTYWVNFVEYLSKRDLDFAYWPLNADKLAEGYFDDWGGWHPYPNGAQWDEDTYSILDEDYYTVRAPWRVLDLRPLMDSPAGAVMNSQPCQRDVLGRVCGG
mmetsp:Transcript_11050/g.24331  ORF Transcript_11050/g.24331 Transcript_11050/m.24331 type:complete len:714 (-) Transcript_11050:145-2286(-)